MKLIDYIFMVTLMIVIAASIKDDTNNRADRLEKQVRQLQHNTVDLVIDLPEEFSIATEDDVLIATKRNDTLFIRFDTHQYNYWYEKN